MTDTSEGEYTTKMSTSIGPLSILEHFEIVGYPQDVHVKIEQI